MDSEDNADEEKICAILGDHGDDNHPSYTTICRHGEYASTIRSVIFYPARKKVKILYGKTCQNQYEEFTFQ